ncbi:MAG: hypothetical protein HY886_00315 [Deltaproteobacteria bacterium]|nr:hypothetical protein [Deltaproteobacteria bacterium]
MLRDRFYLKIVAVVIILVAALYFFRVSQEALATNGAFPSTKHGGGTTDGETPCAGGVNRGLGVDYGGDCTTAATTNAYNSGNTAAGTYKSGECNHCHELHSSFGGAEPYPNTSSFTQQYLLFNLPTTTAGGYAELCWYCHDRMSNIKRLRKRPWRRQVGLLSGSNGL